MNSKLQKRIKSKIFLIRILFKKIFNKKKRAKFKYLSQIQDILKNKQNITVVCSGPSANNLKPSDDDLYLVTNDSFKLVRDYDFLYYVNDGYFLRRFLALAPFNDNHTYNIFFYRDEDHLHHTGYQYFMKHLNLLFGNNYILTNISNDKISNNNYNQLIKNLEKFELPIKFQNSGIFLLLLGFHLAEKYNKSLKIYGLDLGVGGKKHFEKGGHVGKSITNDRVKINTKKQLDIIYKHLGKDVKNYSYFNSNI